MHQLRGDFNSFATYRPFDKLKCTVFSSSDTVTMCFQCSHYVYSAASAKECLHFYSFIKTHRPYVNWSSGSLWRPILSLLWSGKLSGLSELFVYQHLEPQQVYLRKSSTSFPSIALFPFQALDMPVHWKTQQTIKLEILLLA